MPETDVTSRTIKKARAAELLGLTLEALNARRGSDRKKDLGVVENGNVTIRVRPSNRSVQYVATGRRDALDRVLGPKPTKAGAVLTGAELGR